MKGIVEAVSLNKVPKSVGVKINGEWFSAWLQDQDGKPTNTAWLASVKKGDALDFDYEVKGNYKNIVSCKSPVIAPPEPTKTPASQDGHPVQLNPTQLNTCWMTATDYTISQKDKLADMVAAEKCQLDAADRAAAWMLAHSK